MADSFTCPRCGERLQELAGSVPVEGTERELRVPTDCPACETPLSLVVTRTAGDGEVGVELWLEDRRETPDEPDATDR